MIKLVHSRDGTSLKEYPLVEGRYIIGRGPDSDIRIDDDTVSGTHAEITVKPIEFLDGSYEVHIEDKGSTNGTMVNGRPINKHLLKHEEVIRVGLHDLTLIDEDTRSLEATKIVLPEGD